MKEISLNVLRRTKNYRKFVAVVDDEDYEEVGQYSWWVAELGNGLYAATKVSGKIVLMHRLLVPAADNYVIDHVDRNGLNNRKSNLRVCTRKQNQYNSLGRASSGYKGVYKNKKGWQARIRGSGRTVNLGTFQTRKEAAQAYDGAAKEIYGEFAVLNLVSN